MVEAGGAATVVVVESGDVRVVEVLAVVGLLSVVWESVVVGATLLVVVGMAGTAVEVVVEPGGVVDVRTVVVVGDTTTMGTAGGAGERTPR